MIDERLIFYEGKHVRLKVLSAQDIFDSDWVGWFNDELLCAYNQHHYFPNTNEQQHEFLKSCSSRNKIQLGIIDRGNPDKICGVVSLSSIDLLHRHAEIAGIQSTKLTKTSPVLFIEAWSLMLRHGFEQLGLNKIYGGSFHPHAITALIRNFNFEIEGVKKDHVFKNGKYMNCTIVGVFQNTVRYPEI